MTPTAQLERHGDAGRPGKLTKDELFKTFTLVIVLSSGQSFRK
jgi:hypothetical protein